MNLGPVLEVDHLETEALEVCCNLDFVRFGALDFLFLEAFGAFCKRKLDSV